jgi:hypothetical protein
MKNRAWIWVTVLALGGFAVYDFWDGYHPGKSVAAGVVSVILGLIANLFYGNWPPPTNKSKSNRPVI